MCFRFVTEVAPDNEHPFEMNYNTVRTGGNDEHIVTDRVVVSTFRWKIYDQQLQELILKIDGLFLGRRFIAGEIGKNYKKKIIVIINPLRFRNFPILPLLGTPSNKLGDRAFPLLLCAHIRKTYPSLLARTMKSFA